MEIDTSRLAALPATAAWRHLGLRAGFEIAHFSTSNRDGMTRLWGNSLIVEDGVGYAVTYSVSVDENWKTREATIETHTRVATRTTQLLRDEGGGWTVDGRARPDLAGCIDIDLEASLVTNTLPIHRLVENPGTYAVKAAYVQLDCTAGVLDQTYDIPVIGASRFSCAYTAPRFDFTADLHYDETGLILDYPGLATREPVGA
ncbi:putative glycolipid-binding domain-containing protein [Rhodococcus sovatensis]|uniref:Glycolipid-binding domain-containing protein n=1 Tax=Rhodococcus sovatensis TaxID=1805840 RepID=A0ABZ2PMJ9_9NOCA